MLGHAGHWAVQLLYLAPVAVLLIAVLVGRLRSGGKAPPPDDEWDDDER